jgi:hypothetical protein
LSSSFLPNDIFWGQESSQSAIFNQSLPPPSFLQPPSFDNILGPDPTQAIDQILPSYDPGIEAPELEFVVTEDGNLIQLRNNISAAKDRGFDCLGQAEEDISSADQDENVVDDVEVNLAESWTQEEIEEINRFNQDALKEST